MIRQTIDKQLQRIRPWFYQRDFVVVAALFCVTALLFGFMQIAEAVREEGIGLDTKILLALRSAHDPSDPIGPAWFEDLWLNVTAFGSGDVATMLTLAVLGFLLILKEWRTAIVFALAMIGAAVGGTLLKEAFDRARPDLVTPLTEVSSLSFPSGHSLISAVFYPVLGALTTRLITRMVLRLYVVGMAVLLTLMVGFSRVYLGVHYPSDVVAGWMLGFGWAIVCWLVLRALQRRHVVEPPGLPSPAE